MKPKDATTIISPAKEAALLVIPNKGKLPNSLSSSSFLRWSISLSPKDRNKNPQSKSERMPEDLK